MKLQWHVIEAPLAHSPRVEPRFPTPTNWSRWLDSDRSIDPYLMWAELTRFVGFGGLGPIREGDELESNDGRVPILVEFEEKARGQVLPYSLPGVVNQCGATVGACPIEFALFDLQAAYLAREEPAEVILNRRFATGRIALANVQALYEHKDYVRRFQLGIPRLPGQDEAGPFGSTATSSNDVPQTVVGLIDDGFAFAHSQFLDEVGNCRVWALWDQDERRKANEDLGWTAPRVHLNGSRVGATIFGYGAEVGHDTLQSAVELSRCDPSPYAPLCAYRHLRYVPVAPELDLHATQPPAGVSDFTMVDASHGTSVADLAAGSVPPLGRFRRGQSTYVPLPLPPNRGVVSTAPAWPLVLVQLPTRTSLDTSGGSLGVHVLDGVHYIINKAASIPPRAGGLRDNESIIVDTGGGQGSNARPAYRHDLIINISYGATAGPHDGTSILERALEELTYERDEVTRIVLAAGNAHGSKTHARLRLSRGERERVFTWHVGADNPHESYLEIWVPAHSVGGTGSSSADDYTLWIRPPGALPVQRLCVGQAVALEVEGSATPAAAAIFARRVAQGENGTMVLLAVAPTRAPLPGAKVPAATARRRAPHGAWSITVAFGSGSASVGSEMVVVHAWTERNDLVYGTARAQQSWVVSDETVPPPTENFASVREFCRHTGRPFMDEAPAPFAPDFSFGSLAGGRYNPDRVLGSDLMQSNRPKGAVVVVGGYRASDSEMAPYSAGGPARGSDTDNARAPEALCSESAVSPRESASRKAPDLDAASDLGVANRGVPTVGMRPGQGVRLSGTSAAAPTATRAIAEARFVAKQSESTGDGFLQLELDPKQFLPTPPPTTASGRPTLSPHKDGQYRRGRLRVDPQVAVRKKK